MVGNLAKAQYEGNTSSELLKIPTEDLTHDEIFNDTYCIMRSNVMDVLAVRRMVGEGPDDVYVRQRVAYAVKHKGMPYRVACLRLKCTEEFLVNEILAKYPY